MRVGHVIEYCLFQLAAGVVHVLPLRFVRSLGARMGSAAYFSWGYRRNVALDNLRKAFPEKAERELREIARGAFRNVGITFFELMWLSRMTSERLRGLVRFDKPDVITRSHAKGKGTLLLTAHFGNWEWLAQGVVASLGLPVHIIVKTQANLLVDRRINERRTRLGNKVVATEAALREVLKQLREGNVIGIVADQAAPRENAPVEFFGRPVPTHLGPAIFSLKIGAPLVAIFSLRQPDGNYDAQVLEIATDDLREFSEENVIELTRRHVKITEEFIRKYPDHWMWMHKRWKHVADDSGEDRSSTISTSESGEKARTPPASKTGTIKVSQ
ncbi:MAG: lysophospholipid acyltransferase family protein [Ignavibacteria bacterium]|nr:lysophospholipid acyltransferase family protein [Ignavibacteria bacterium]